MGFWKKTFSKLPNIYDISIQNKNPGFNASQVVQEFFCVASICPEVNIGYYDQIDLAFRNGIRFHH